MPNQENFMAAVDGWKNFVVKSQFPGSSVWRGTQRNTKMGYLFA